MVKGLLNFKSYRLDTLDIPGWTRGETVFNLLKKLIIAGAVAVCAVPVFAADMPESAPVVEQPAAPNYGGWYIRGDVDYHKSDFRGADYITYGNPTPLPGTGSFDYGDLKGSFSLGGGVGYQVTNHFRVDVTGDYWFKSKFNGGTSCATCTSTEVSHFSALLLLANAYADLGTYHGITPYIGAGIGGAHVKWDSVSDPNTTEFNPGTSNWRFAYALMAGASYCLTDKLILDAGYRFSHIQGGRMFEYDASSAGPGFDKGFNTHEVRGGLRYQFGGNTSCSAPVVAYEPEPEPLYTK